MENNGSIVSPVGSLRGNFAPVAAGVAPASKSRYPNLNRTLEGTAPNTDVAFLSDPDHYDLKNQGPMADKGFMQGVRRAGYTDAYLEFPREWQSHAREYAAGKISRGDFINRTNQATIDATGKIMQENSPSNGRAIGDALAKPEIRQLIAEKLEPRNNLMADQIDAARAAGMGVHFVDPRSVEEHTRLEMMQGREYDAASQRTVEQHDASVADYINQSRRGKALVQYGSLHIRQHAPASDGSRAGNIDDALRDQGARTMTVEMTGDPQARQAQFRNERVSPSTADGPSYRKGVDVPDYVYSPGTDTILPTQAGPVVRPGVRPN